MHEYNFQHDECIVLFRFLSLNNCKTTILNKLMFTVRSQLWKKIIINHHTLLCI